MKRLTALLLTLLLLLSACAPLPPEPTEMETEPTAPPTDEMTPVGDGDAYNVNGEETIGSTEAEVVPIDFDSATLVGLQKNKESLDDADLVYTGGEMQLAFSFKAQRLEEGGLAIYLFLDGMLQPFRLEEGGALAYVHTIYPETGLKLQSLYFTPTTGRAGDMLELTLRLQPLPDYVNGQQLFLGDFNVSKLMEKQRPLEAWVAFEADPPEAELPAAEKTLLSWSVSSEALSDADFKNVDESLIRWYSYGDLTVNGENSKSYSPTLYGLTEQAVLEVRYEVMGRPEGQFSILFLLNGQPVSVAPEDWMALTFQEGQKFVIEARIRLEGFENFGNFRVICIDREGGDYLDLTGPTNLMYLSAADSYQAHVTLLEENQ